MSWHIYGPHGPEGPQGPRGISWRNSGWVTATVYEVDDALTHNGVAYRAYAAHTSAALTEPGIGADWATVWKVLADKGAESTAVQKNTQTANYVLVIGDAGKVVEMNLAGANTLTVPPNASVGFPIGTIIEVHQYGAGQTTITPGAGVTLRSNGGKLKTSGQYASASLRKRNTDEWVVAGDLSA